MKFHKVSSLVKGNSCRRIVVPGVGLRRWTRIVNMRVDSMFSGIRLSEGPLDPIRYPYQTPATYCKFVIFQTPTCQAYEEISRHFSSSAIMHILSIGKRAPRNTIGALGRNHARIEISSNVSKSNYAHIISPTEGVNEFTDCLAMPGKSVNSLIQRWNHNW